jgi:REP element-mobilizing transposase RayT
MTDRTYDRRHLPHWQPPGATFFVTFCLKYAPETVMDPVGEAAQITDARKSDPQETLFPGDRSFLDWERRSGGAFVKTAWLARPEIAAIVAEALHYRDGKDYDLLAFCIMPTHVHVLFTLLVAEATHSSVLGKVMQSLKKHTARQANLQLYRSGPFWQDESFDHIIRNDEEFLRVLSYILENPVKAGLVLLREEYPWMYCKPGLL